MSSRNVHCSNCLLIAGEAPRLWRPDTQPRPRPGHRHDQADRPAQRGPGAARGQQARVPGGEAGAGARQYCQHPGEHEVRDGDEQHVTLGLHCVLGLLRDPTQPGQGSQEGDSSSSAYPARHQEDQERLCCPRAKWTANHPRS